MKKIMICIAACVLLICTLIGGVSAQTAPTAMNQYPDLDYSLGKKSTEMLMGDVLEQFLGQEVTEAEKNAIRYMFDGEKTLKYIRPSIIDPTYTYDGEKQQLTVIVMEHFIPGSSGDGRYLRWVPTRVTVGDQSATFAPKSNMESNYYRAIVDGVSWSESVSLTIEYGATLTLSADTLNDFINFAYDQAVLLDQAYTNNEIAVEEYHRQLEAYQKNQADWEKYREDMDAYRTHQSRVAVYEDYLLYQTYLSDMEIYDSDMEEYTANQAAWQTYNTNYAKFQEYLAYSNQYPTIFANYQKDKSLAEQQLALFELMQQKDSVTGVSFMEMVINDEVMDKLLENKTLISTWVDAAAYDNIEQSSKYLKQYFETFRSLSTDRERYEFFAYSYTDPKDPGKNVDNYKDLIKNLKMMYDGINRLYNNNTAYAYLKNHYTEYISSMIRMTAYLYVYNAAFNANVSLDMNYPIDSRDPSKKVRDVVDLSLCPAKDPGKDAEPLDAWPVAPIKPEAMEITSEPTRPAGPIARPVARAYPTFRVVTSHEELEQNMTDPGFMAQPVPPVEELQHPGAVPSLPWGPTEQALYQAYLEEKIVQRPLFGADQTFRLTVPVVDTTVLDTDELYYFVRFHNSDNQNTFLGYAAVLPGQAAAYPANLALPTLPELNDRTFAFDGWVDENGDPVDLSAITQTISVYAHYQEIPKEFFVTWNVDGTTTQEKYFYGEIPVYKGSLDKAADKQYTYEFTDWDKEILPVTGDVTYTAGYKSTQNRYKVTFVMGDGSLIENEYNYGKPLGEVLPAQKPVKAPTAEYSYTFIGWKDEQGNMYQSAQEFPTLEGNMTFTSQFSSSKNTYTVTWNVDGEVITQTYEYGQMPAYSDDPEVVPTRESTDQFDYKFIDWDKEVSAVTGDVTYTALFSDLLRSYRIDFVVEGEVTSTVLEYGQMPQFEGTPSKPSDVQYVYSFIGWDKDIEPVSKDAVYTARFGQTLQKYPVKFVVDDAEFVSDFEYGSVPEYPYETPTRPDDSLYYYEFIGWDKTIVAVDGSEAVYTACFKAIPWIPDESDSDQGTEDPDQTDDPNQPDDPGENQVGGSLIIGEDGVFRATLSGNEIDLSSIFSKAGEAQAPALQVLFGQAMLEFPKAQIDAVYNMGGGIGKVSMSCITYENRTAYEISIFDENGQHAQFLVSELTVKLPYNGVYSADVYHVEDDGSLKKLDSRLENGYLVFSTLDFSTFVIMEKFKITGNATQNGVISMVGEAYDGEEIIITPDPDEGYHVDSIVLEADGKQTVIEPRDGVYSFVMPKGNVTVSATFKVVEGGTGSEVLVGVITAVLIVAIGIVIAIIFSRKRTVKIR